MELLNGDCIERMKTLPDKSIDLFLCDLPYGCLTGGGGKEKADGNEGVVAGCAWDIKIDLPQFWEQVKRLRKNKHTPVLHFCNARFGFELYNSNPDWFRYDLVWNKTNAVGFLRANKMPMSSHENIYVFAEAGATYYRKDIEGDFPETCREGHKRSSRQNTYPAVADQSQSNAGRRCVKSVFEFANKKSKGGHPTQKPADLYRFLIERYSKEGDTILDPTFGSGTSGLVARELRRNYIGIEKDPTFFERASSSLRSSPESGTASVGRPECNTDLSTS